MELKENNTYILKLISSETVFKVKILELTKTSIQVENLDNKIIFRLTLENFKNSYIILELIHDFNKSIEDAIKKMNKQPIEFKKFEENPLSRKIHIHIPIKKCSGPCLCNGDCRKNISWGF
jgi:hypothetical protein